MAKKSTKERNMKLQQSTEENGVVILDKGGQDRPLCEADI